MIRPVAEPIRIGLVGAGMVSAYHLPAWKALEPRIRLCGLAEPDEARARACAREYGVGPLYDSLEALLRAQPLDAVDIMTPPELHGQHCRLAASAGVAILCQKPLAPSWSEARAIAQDLGARVRWMVHENWRFRPHYRQVQRWLQDGAIGRLRSGRLEVRSSGLLVGPDGMRPALVRQPLLGRLPRLMLAEVLIHHLDIACWLSPARELRRAITAHAIPALPGETAAEVLLADAADTLSFEVSGDMADPSAPETLRDRMWLHGNAGEIRLDENGLHLDSHGLRESMFVDFDVDYRRSYAGAIAHFAECLSAGRPFEAKPDWHLGLLALVERVYEMAGTSATRPQQPTLS